MTYDEFIAKKKRTIKDSGFHIEVSELNQTERGLGGLGSTGK